MEKMEEWKNAQRETTLRPPLRRRCTMGEPLTPIRNCGSDDRLSNHFRRKFNHLELHGCQVLKLIPTICPRLLQLLMIIAPFDGDGFVDQAVVEFRRVPFFRDMIPVGLMQLFFLY